MVSVVPVLREPAVLKVRESRRVRSVSRLTVTVSVAVTAVVRLVPPATSTMLPSATVSLPESPDRVQEG